MLISKILLPNGTAITSGEDAYNAIQGVNLTQSVNTGTELTLGSVCSNMMEASIITPAGELELEAGMEVELYQNDVPMGLYTLEKPTRTSANMLKLVAYDRVSRLDVDLSQWLQGLVDWPYSLYKLAWMVCAQCGLELKNTQLPNGNYPVAKFSAQSITGRQLMQWIGQATGRFCRATTDGKIEFAWYQDARVSMSTQEKTDSAQGNAAVLQNVPKNAVLRPVTTISGKTDTLTLYHCGKNLLDFTKAKARKPDQSVQILNSGVCWKAGGDYFFEIPTFVPAGCYVVLRAQWESKAGEALSHYTCVFADGTYSSNMQFSRPYIITKKVVAVRLYKTAVSTPLTQDLTVTNMQLELGQEATKYQRYNGAVYTVALPQAVTSGSFDWSTGVLSTLSQQLSPVTIPALQGYNVLMCDFGVTAVDYEQLKDVSYTPCQFSLPGSNALHPGDILQITDRNGNSICTYVMQRNRAAQKDAFISTGSANRNCAAVTNQQSFASINGKVMHLRADMDGLKAENREAGEKMAGLELDVEGIRTAVSRQEGDAAATKQRLTTLEQSAEDVKLQVESVVENGASKVVTKTGFTFDEEGLTIAKSNSDLTNKITEQGMYVLRNDGSTMLQADASGVMAADVTVQNYLLLGEHTRFEEYISGGEERIACFYIGG